MFNFLAPSLNYLSNNWQNFFTTNLHEALEIIDDQLNIIQQTNTIFPPQELIFRALSNVEPDKVKVVILGQDPYHGVNEANGLAFAVNTGVKLPPSLHNIYKELENEYGKSTTKLDGSLLNLWAQAGVLLLNCALTVLKDQPNSLAHIGWHKITDQIIQYISDQSPSCVFMLWGNFAKSKKTLINIQKHLVLETTHPSPFSARYGFSGSNHFKLANEFLQSKHLAPINWLP